MKHKLNTKQILIIASTWFGTIFGAGNLIFPVHMGQLAGENFNIAAIGFIVTAVGLPILAVFAILASKSTGLFSFASKVSNKFAYFFSVVLCMGIGPCFVVPRSALIAYNAGLANIIGDGVPGTVGRIVFCLLFFALVLIFVLRPSQITVTIGKIINPIFLIVFGVLLVTTFINPMADVNTIEPATAYENTPFFSGFLEGYGTMDVFSCLAFGMILINIVKDAGITKTSYIAKGLVRPALVTTIAMSIIYFATIVMGTQSVGIFGVSTNGSIALSQISNHYFGIFGDIILFVIVCLASLKTDIGLMTSCSEAFVEMFPNRLSYKKWTIIFFVVTFVFTLLGLDVILDLGTPFLAFLYPICIVFMILSFIGPTFKFDTVVYKWTIGFTCISAFFDFVSSLPVWVIDTFSLHSVCSFTSSVFPLSDVGFSWVMPAFVGFAIGIIVYNVGHRKSVKESAK